MISDVYNKKNRPLPSNIELSKENMDQFPSSIRRKQKFDPKFKDLQEVSAPEKISLERPIEIQKIADIDYKKLIIPDHFDEDDLKEDVETLRELG